MPISQFLIKAYVYYNGVAPPIELWLPDDTKSLVVLTSKLNELLSDIDNRKVRKI